MTVEASGIIARKLTLERKPGNMLPVVADAIQILGVFHFHLDLSALKPGEDYAHRAKVCPESEARFCTLCIGLPHISGNIFRPRETFTQIWGKESW